MCVLSIDLLKVLGSIINVGVMLNIYFFVNKKVLNISKKSCIM